MLSEIVLHLGTQEIPLGEVEDRAAAAGSSPEAVQAQVAQELADIGIPTDSIVRIITGEVNYMNLSGAARHPQQELAKKVIVHRVRLAEGTQLPQTLRAQ